MLFFIQFSRIPPSWRLRVAFRAPVLRWRRGDTGTLVPVSATTKFFSLQVEPTGMLAPEVQATTIEIRVRRGSDGSQWRRQIRLEIQIYVLSPLASATEGGTARARAQFLSSWISSARVAESGTVIANASISEAVASGCLLENEA